MTKRSVLAAVAAVVAIAILASASLALSEKDVFELQCNLAGKSGSSHYAFHLKIPKYFGQAQLVMVGHNTYDLKVVRFDNTKIYATLDQKLASWPSDNTDLMSFNFNRI